MEHNRNRSTNFWLLLYSSAIVTEVFEVKLLQALRPLWKVDSRVLSFSRVEMRNNQFYSIKFLAPHRKAVPCCYASAVFSSFLQPKNATTEITDSFIVSGRLTKQLTQSPDRTYIDNASGSETSTAIEVAPEAIGDDIPGKSATSFDLDKFDPVKFWKDEREKFETAKKTEEAAQYDAFDNMGFPLFSYEEIERMDTETLRNELRIRGYRNDGSDYLLKLRLQKASKLGHQWDKVDFKLAVDVFKEEKSKPLQDSIDKRVNLFENCMEELSSTSGDPTDAANVFARWDKQIAASQAINDPAKFFNLDKYIPEKDFSHERAESLEVEPEYELPKAVNPHEADDFIAEEISKTYEIQEEGTRTNRIRQELPDPISNDEKKERYLGHHVGGLADHTVEELASLFQVPADFIGDVLCKGGATTPIPKNVKVRELVNLSVIWDLVELISISDPLDITEYYPAETISMLASEYKLPLKRILELCALMGIKLPFGEDSCINEECHQALLEAVSKEISPNTKL